MFPISFKETNQPKHLRFFSPWWNSLGWWRLVWSVVISRYFINRLSGCCFRWFRWGGCHEVGVNIRVGWEDQILRCAPQNLPQRFGCFNSFREVCFRFCLFFVELYTLEKQDVVVYLQGFWVRCVPVCSKCSFVLKWLRVYSCVPFREKNAHELSLFLEVGLYLSSSYTSGIQSTVQKMYNKRLGWITRFDTGFSCWFMMSLSKLMKT